MIRILFGFKGIQHTKNFLKWRHKPMNVREAVVQRRWSNSHDVRFPCIHLEEIKTVILCNNITVDTKRFHECLNHFNSYHNSSFFKLFMHGFYWYREFDWQLTTTLSWVDWRNDWHMYVFLVFCKTVLHFLPFRRCFIIVLWHSKMV